MVNQKKNSHAITINQSDTLTTDDLRLDNLFNNFFSKIGSDLRQQIPINVKDPLSFFDDTVENDSALRFYESTPDKVRMLVRKLPK